MRRWLWCVPVAAGVAAAALISSRPAQSAKSDEGSGVKAGPALPITQAVLFSSGVGHFLREGEVEGNARVDLTFQVTDINDLLKSMVLQDLGGGQVAAVSYDSLDPVERTLKSFAIDLSKQPTLGQILTQARGEKVEVVLQPTVQTQPGTLTGAIIGVEKKKEVPAGGKDAVEVEVLNLWCAEGIRSVKLSELQRMRFLSPVIEGEVRKALEALALSHDAQKKAVSLSFAGEGKRPVRVGYVVENPIWKTSYRLVVGKDGKPFLQGWAVVDNPTDEDWTSVRMALISGRPISFKMDLYTPLYVPRPQVELELFASLRPPTYEGGIAQMKGYAAASDPQAPGRRGVGQSESMEKAKQAGLAATDKQTNLRAEADAKYAKDSMDRLSERVDLGAGVRSAATASQLGDFFQYLIDAPVTLPRQKSALLPIVNKEIEGDRVSIYNARTHPKFPMLGLKLKNTSGLHLMQGPLTVLEGSVYAGDAKVPDLQPNEERLLAYAVDLGTEVENVNPTVNQRFTKVRIQRGVVHRTLKFRLDTVYSAKNRSTTDRTLLIEHPYRPEFKLISKEEPVERARDVYRFEVKVPAGKTISQTISEERDIQQTVSLSNADSNQIRLVLNLPVASEAVKAAMRKVLEHREKLTKAQQDLQEVERQLNVIVQDQTRLRANLREMPPTAAAYKRYLEKFDLQETQIEKYQAQQKELQQAEHQLRQQFEAFLVSLDIE